jgi:hypothetical protein
MAVLAVSLARIDNPRLIRMFVRKKELEMFWIHTARIGALVMYDISVRDRTDKEVVHSPMGKTHIPLPIDTPISIDKRSRPMPALF